MGDAGSEHAAARKREEDRKAGGLAGDKAHMRQDMHAEGCHGDAKGNALRIFKRAMVLGVGHGVSPVWGRT